MIRKNSDHFRRPHEALAVNVQSRFLSSLVIAAAVLVPGCRSADSACKRAKELTSADGRGVSKAGCFMRIHELKGAERDALVDCLNDAADAEGIRSCLK